MTPGSSAVATGPEAPAPLASAPPSSPQVQSAAMSTTLNPRLAPQDVEAERSILGGILLTNEAFYDVLETVKTDDFYREPHRKVFAAMQELSQRNEPIDVITLADELRRGGDLESVGGVAYLSGLDAFVPATANITRYARIVRDKALARRLIGAAHEIAREGYDQLGPVDELLDAAESKIFEITEKKAANAFTVLGTSVKRVFSNLEALYERQTEITGVPTGFTAFDKMTAGLQKGDLIIVGGRPSMGKTSVVMNMAGHIAIEEKRPVAVFSLEMSADSLTTRLFASEARVDGQRLRTGKLLDSDWPKLARAADRLFKAPMHIDDSAGLTALEMRAKCRRLKAKTGELALVVVDYLQLMRGKPGTDSREQEISEISRGLKALAREMECPVIALSQLNRSLEKREDKRPQMSDLRESGAIEQDADLICFIYRDEVYNKENSPDKGIAEIIIGKQRNGPTGTVRVAFQRDYTRFENLAEEQSYGPGE
ncbi:MAG: replicative helicase [Pseudomonadota bacterium]